MKIKFQSHIGSVFTWCSLRGVSVRNSVCGMHFHILHKLFPNRTRIPTGILQATADEHFRVSGN